MDRKKFFKTTCGMGLGSCVGLCFLAESRLFGNTLADKNIYQETEVVKADARQVQNVLSYIESTMDEKTTGLVFDRLGYEHTTNELYRKYLEGYRKNIKSYFDMVNSGKDTYWEKMTYNPDKSEIGIIGKVVDKCACAYAQAPDPPKSLCTHCCKGFQKNMFEIMLEKPVEVRIDAAYLLGDNRCSTTIFVKGKLPLERI